ncbi:hypothetical protein MJH12_17600 [bacterium]|nr:hypothetical protein [bacterium]
MSKLYEKLCMMELEELESLLRNTDNFSYRCDRKVFLALVIKVLKSKKSEFVKSKVL